MAGSNHGDSWEVSEEQKGYHADVNIANAENFEEDSHHHLHRGLKSRQIAMIAIGGAIGTGLIIGTFVSSLPRLAIFTTSKGRV
jgi:yeast amino acid transporter